jgi:hypothetical protein
MLHTHKSFFFLFLYALCFILHFHCLPILILTSELNFLLIFSSFFSNLPSLPHSYLPLLSFTFLPVLTVPILLIIFIFFITFISTCLLLNYTLYSTSSSFLLIHKYSIQAL